MSNFCTMLSILFACTLLSSHSQQGVKGAEDYKPSGPKIVFSLASGSSFTVTTDPARSPETVKHVLALVRNGFYDRQRFHRVEWWVTQWGAPESISQPLDVKDPKTGKMAPSESVGDGGSGKDIRIFEGSRDVDFYRGVVGVASNGLQLPGDSQLFIIKRDAFRLWNSYAVVGKVTDGMDAVGRIQRGDRIKSATVK